MQSGSSVVDGARVHLPGLSRAGRAGQRSSSSKSQSRRVFPAQVPRGQSTVLNVAFPGRDLVVQAAEISPSAGVTVSGIKRAADSQGVAWWEVTVDVAKDAAPGNRSLVLVMPMGLARFPHGSRFQATFPASLISGSCRRNRISQPSNCNSPPLTRLPILAIHRMSGSRLAAVNPSWAWSKAK